MAPRCIHSRDRGPQPSRGYEHDKSTLPVRFSQVSPPAIQAYRPASCSGVIGQAKILRRLDLLRDRTGLAGRAYWFAGKTTIARLIASELADEWAIEEVDATDLSAARIRDLERSS